MDDIIGPKLKNISDFKIILDYFNFEENDIDLHKIKKCYNLFLRDFKMKKHHLDQIEKDFQEFLLFFEKNDFSKNTFPYLKNSVTGYLTAQFAKYDNNYHNYYFMMKILSQRQRFSKMIKNFYLTIIRNNYFGISPKFSGVITREVLVSEEYNKFTANLAEWYTKIEIIIFYTTLLNLFFGVMLFFDDKKYSLENNFDFSIQTFAKKNFLKLASYVCKKSSLDVKVFGNMNYNRILFLVASSFTCGVSIKDIFGGDVKRIALVAGGLLVNYILGKIADKIDNYSNFVEFSRLERIIIRLNKKIEKIHKKVYELLKLVILQKVDFDYNSQTSKNKTDFSIYPNIDQKIEELFSIVKTYFEGVEKIQDGFEKEILNNNLQFSFEEDNLNNSVIDEEWIFINICNKIKI